MSKGMKILRACMVALLATLCVAVAVAVFMQGRGNDSGDAGRYIGGAPFDEDDIEEPEEEPEEDRRFWQRVSRKREDTGLWVYYPLIPWDVQPGETAVLSVSAKGFKGWEVDSNFANIELFNESSDEEYVFISFIMPDEKVSIAALYENEIPHINFIKTNNMIMSAIDNIEHGSVPIMPLSDDSFVIVPGGNVRLRPDAMVDVWYDPIQIRPPANVHDDLDDDNNPLLEWVFSGAHRPGLNGVAGVGNLAWLTFWHSPGENVDGTVGGGFFVSVDTPTVNGTFTFNLTIMNKKTGFPESMSTITIFVARAGALPDIVTTDIPDAMVGVPYSVDIQTANLPSLASNDSWVWLVEGDLPDDFDLYATGDTTTGVLESKGTLGPTVAGGPHDFTLTIYPASLIYDDVVANYSLQVWPRLTIAPIAAPSVPTTPGGAVILLPGIANVNGVLKDYNDGFNYTPITAAGTALGKPNANWSWIIENGDLPSGLSIINIADAIVYITGTPTRADKFSFTLRYTANTSVLIGWVEQEYYIEIYQPPSFITGADELPDGMEDKTLGDSSEPDEPIDWYNTAIRADGFPAGTEWTWAVSGTQPAGTLHFSPITPPGIISDTTPSTGAATYPFNTLYLGVPGPNARGDYAITMTFECTDTSPNIIGATVERTFSLRIWPRTYLYATRVGAGGIAHIRRDDDKDPDWNWMNPDGIRLDNTEMAKYQGRRAVTPGTRAIVQIESGNSFVRWEVSPNFNASGDIILPAAYTNASRLASIGREDPNPTGPMSERSGWGIQNQQLGYAIIRMPNSNNLFPAPLVVYNEHVYVSGQALGAGRSIITTEMPLTTGTVGTDYQTQMIANSADISRDGSTRGVVDLKWEISPPGALPDDLKILENVGARSAIEGVPAENTDGIFPFTVRLTLPGSMVIEKPFSITIRPWDGLGDIDGSGFIDLRDLVLFVRWFENPSIEINMRNARLARPNEIYTPGMADIRILARYLGSSLGSLDP